MMAAALDRIQVLEKLLHFGAKLDHIGKRGETALIMAAVSGKVAAIEFLLRKGAKVDLVVNHKTALLAACYQGTEATISMLLSKDASVSLETENGYTPLILSSIKSLRATVVKILVQKRANVFQTNKFVRGLSAGTVDWMFANFFLLLLFLFFLCRAKRFFSILC